jgi:hypothetical protein
MTLQKSARIEQLPLRDATITRRFLRARNSWSVKRQLGCALTNRVESSQVHKDTAKNLAMRKNANTPAKSNGAEAHEWVHPANKKGMEFGI